MYTAQEFAKALEILKDKAHLPPGTLFSECHLGAVILTYFDHFHQDWLQSIWCPMFAIGSSRSASSWVSSAMLHVYSAISGDLIQDLDETLTADALSDSLTAATGLLRFQQRFLEDEDQTSTHLVALPFCPPDLEQAEALISSCQRNDVQKVEHLLRQPQDPNQTDVFGKTALHCAAEHGSKECIRLLASAGADMNFQLADGATPLHLAALQGHTEVVGLLFQHGAKLDMATNKGATPLHVAATQGHVKTVRWLLALGAQSHLETDAGATALSLAANACHLQVVQALLPKEPPQRVEPDSGRKPTAF